MNAEITELLLSEAARINSPEFIAADPVQFPRRFLSSQPDAEIVSLLAANIGDYFPSMTDLAMMAGSVGLFMALYMALVRVAPFFSLCDVREQQSLNKEGGA